MGHRSPSTLTSLLRCNVKKRAKFDDVKQRLQRLSYAMLYPARLRITAQGQMHFFNTAGEAVVWLDVHEPSLSAHQPEEADT